MEYRWKMHPSLDTILPPNLFHTASCNINLRSGFAWRDIPSAMICLIHHGPRSIQLSSLTSLVGYSGFNVAEYQTFTKTNPSTDRRTLHYQSL